MGLSTLTGKGFTVKGMGDALLKIGSVRTVRPSVLNNIVE